MASAITSSTGEASQINYTHVGIAIPGNPVDSVLEATSEGGVRLSTLEDFLEQAAKIDGKPVVVAMRLRDTTGVAVAVRRAYTCIGTPYDYSFLPEGGKLYCSELIWESYRAADGSPLFTARPMNFRAADGSMSQFWIDLFAKQGMEIPEGVLGTNPNDMSQEEILECVYRYF